MANEELLQELRARMDAIITGPGGGIRETSSSHSDDDARGCIARYGSGEHLAADGDGLALSARQKAGSSTRKNGAKRGRGGANLNPTSVEDAFAKIVAIVNASDKSERALRTRLERERFEPCAIEPALEKAKRLLLVDDIRYASVLVRSRVAQGKGSRGIERELAENNIDPGSIPGWPDEFDLSEESERKRALMLLERKPPRSKNKREAAYRKLVQRGFSTAIASSVAREWCESLDS